MNEYGGYIQLDTYTGKEYYSDSNFLALNSGRTALRFFIRTRKIRNLMIPSFCCDTVQEACQAEGISCTLYSTGSDLRPLLSQPLKSGQWLYLVNLYGILTNCEINCIHQQYPRMIADYTHAFFQPPLPDVDTLYSCRKFWGVADGAYLYLAPSADSTDILSQYKKLSEDSSHDRVHFLLGRFEKSASDFYQEYVENDNFFSSQPARKMSPLTHNLLRAIDYELSRKRRSQNFQYLNRQLRSLNRLALPNIPGAYAYPFWPKPALPAGEQLRQKMIQKKVYTPCLWPEVNGNQQEKEMAQNILPLPVDQRYTQKDMAEILERLLSLL